jgi:hypothetical protein
MAFSINTAMSTNGKINSKPPTTVVLMNLNIAASVVHLFGSEERLADKKPSIPNKRDDRCLWNSPVPAASRIPGVAKTDDCNYVFSAHGLLHADK